jgi:hypothetical protein
MGSCCGVVGVAHASLCTQARLRDVEEEAKELDEEWQLIKTQRDDCQRRLRKEMERLAHITYIHTHMHAAAEEEQDGGSHALLKITVGEDVEDKPDLEELRRLRNEGVLAPAHELLLRRKEERSTLSKLGGHVSRGVGKARHKMACCSAHPAADKPSANDGGPGAAAAEAAVETPALEPEAAVAAGGGGGGGASPRLSPAPSATPAASA